MHFFHRFWIGHEKERYRRNDYLSYFAAVSHQFAFMEVADRARCAARNPPIMAELKRPFAHKPCVLLPAEKRRAARDLLLITRECNFQRQPDR